MKSIYFIVSVCKIGVIFDTTKYFISKFNNGMRLLVLVLKKNLESLKKGRLSLDFPKGALVKEGTQECRE